VVNVSKEDKPGKQWGVTGVS